MNEDQWNAAERVYSLQRRIVKLEQANTGLRESIVALRERCERNHPPDTVYCAVCGYIKPEAPVIDIRNEHGKGV